MYKISLKNFFALFALPFSLKETVLVLLLLSILGSCSSKKEKPAVAAKENASLVYLSSKQIEAVGIKLGAMQKRQLNIGVKVNGVVDVPPNNYAKVSAPVQGFVKNTNILVGTHVHKGDVLATLSHPDYIKLQQDYLEARSHLEFSEKEYNRQQILAEDNINSKKNLQLSKAEFQSSSARVKAFEANMHLLGISPASVAAGNIQSTISILAPLDGEIAVVNSTMGKFVRPDEVLFEIVNKDHLHLELTVYENDVLKVKKGQSIVYNIPNSSEQHKATVILISKRLDPVNRTVVIHGHLQDTIDLLPGMYVNATILTNEVTVNAVPESALIKQGEIAYVFVKTGEKDGKYQFQKIPVKTGVTEYGFVEIVSMPVESDSIVLEGAYYLSAEIEKQDVSDQLD